MKSYIPSAIMSISFFCVGIASSVHANEPKEPKESPSVRFERECIKEVYKSERANGVDHKEAKGNAKDACREANEKSKEN